MAIVTRNQPQGLVRLNPANRFVKKLAFVVTSGNPFDAVSGKQAATYSASSGQLKGLKGFQTTGSGKQVEFNLAPMSTSSGDGLGDFTIFAFSDAPSESVGRTLYSQKNDSLGSPYTQIGLYVNSANFGASAGTLTISGYSGNDFGGDSIGAPVDGNLHLFMAVRRGGVFQLYSDGLPIGTTQRKATGSPVWAAGQLTGIGAEGGTGGSPNNRVIPSAGSFNFGMSDADVAEFYANTWQLFQAPQRLQLKAAGTTNTAVNPSVGSIALTGYSPTLTQSANQSVVPGVGSLNITGYAPSISQPQAIIAGTGSLALTGYAPSVAQSASGNLTPGTGSIALTGYAPTVTQPQSITVGAGLLSITGYAPTVSQNITTTVAPGAGSISISGYAPTLAQTANQQVSPAVGTVTFTGFAPSIAQTANQTVTAGAGSVAITGYAPSVQQAQASPNLTPGVGSLTITGYAPTLYQGPPISIGAPDYSAYDKPKQYLVKRGEQLFVYRSKAQALAAFKAEQDAEDEPAEKSLPRAVKRAQKQAIDLPQVEAYAKDAGRLEQYQQAYTSQHLDALLAMFNDMRDEDDLELLLLAS